jgi:hypothetical protein
MQQYLDGKAYAEPQLTSMIRWMAMTIFKAPPTNGERGMSQCVKQ